MIGDRDYLSLSFLFILFCMCFFLFPFPLLRLSPPKLVLGMDSSIVFRKKIYVAERIWEFGYDSVNDVKRNHGYNISVFLQSIEKEIRGQVDDAIARAKVRRYCYVNLDCSVALVKELPPAHIL